MKNIKVSTKFIALALATAMTLSGCGAKQEPEKKHSESLTTTHVSTIEYFPEEGKKIITIETTTTENDNSITKVEKIEEAMDYSEYKMTEIKTTDQVNIRKGPSTDSEVVETVPSGTILQSLYVDGEWYAIFYEGEKAYVNADYVYVPVEKEGFYKENTKYQIDEVEIENVNYAEARTTVNIREDATTDSNILGQLSEGQKLEIVRVLTNGWVEVSYNDGLAYINADYIVEKNEERIISPFNKIVMFNQESNIYDRTTKEVIESVPEYEVAFVYSEDNDMYLATVNDKLCYVNKSDTIELDDKIVIVDLSDQQAKLYDGNDILVDTPIVSGKPSTPSDIGLFDIDWKERNCNLEGPGYSSYVDYWMPFNGGEGLHDAEYHTDYDENGNVIKSHGWRSYGEFGGNTHEYAGSHGCTNLPNQAAKEIYNNVEVGTPVLVKR